MRLIATDQASNVSGIAVLDDGVPIHYEAIDLSKDKDPEPRTKDLFLGLVGIR